MSPVTPVPASRPISFGLPSSSSPPFFSFSFFLPLPALTAAFSFAS